MFEQKDVCAARVIALLFPSSFCCIITLLTHQYSQTTNYFIYEKKRFHAFGYDSNCFNDDCWMQ